VEGPHHTPRGVVEEDRIAIGDRDPEEQARTIGEEAISLPDPRPPDDVDGSAMNLIQSGHRREPEAAQDPLLIEADVERKIACRSGEVEARIRSAGDPTLAGRKAVRKL
jgi:hypothetical protein